VLDPVAAVTGQTERQVAHWARAASNFRLDDLASPEAWGHLERYLGLSIRRHLTGVIDHLVAEANALVAAQRAASSPTAIRQVHAKLLAFRRQYLRTETTLDFFADAINTRTNPRMGALMRACDTIAYRSMALVLDQLGVTTPPVLTFPDKGLGAAIIKANLRLWDGNDLNPVATIRIAEHNLDSPTSLVHEAGHQVAHLTGWNDELARVLHDGLAPSSRELAGLWASWASELAGDALAFATTGYASVTALHDVLAGDLAVVLQLTPGDPHPVSYLRVLLCVEMCRYFYGAGAWDDMALSWTALHPTQAAPVEVRALLDDSLPLLKTIVRLTLDTPMRAFKGRPLRALVQPERVSPAALAELEGRIGPALFTSAHWLWTEPLRILALAGLRAADRPRQLNDILQTQEDSMLRLGGALQAA
jgi:hypothetical protein